MLQSNELSTSWYHSGDTANVLGQFIWWLLPHHSGDCVPAEEKGKIPLFLHGPKCQSQRHMVIRGVFAFKPPWSSLSLGLRLLISLHTPLRHRTRSKCASTLLLYVYVCVCMCMYVYVCVCMCVYVYVCVCMCMYVYVCVCMCMYVCMYVCRYVCRYVGM